MRKFWASSVLVLVILLSCSVPGVEAAKTSEVGIGDWWEYAFSNRYLFWFGDQLNVTETGTVRLNITSEATALVKGVSQKVFLLTVTGTSSGGGTAPNTTFSVTHVYSGRVTRLASSFDLIASHVSINETEKTVKQWPEWLGGTRTLYVNSTYGYSVDFDSPMDDYVGDSDLETFTQSENESLYRTELISAIGGTQPDTEETNGSYGIRIRMFESSTPCTVPAGTFQCTRLQVNESVDGHATESFWYYSADVGNYVSCKGTAMFGGMFGSSDIKLKAFSYDPPAADAPGILSMPVLVILAVIVIAVVAILFVVRGAKKKRYRKRGY